MKKEHEASLTQAVAKEAGQAAGAIIKLKSLRKELKTKDAELDTLKREREEATRRLAHQEGESNREVGRLQSLLEKARLALERSVDETRRRQGSTSGPRELEEEEESGEEVPEYESLLLDKIQEAASSGPGDFWGQGMQRMEKSPPGRRHKPLPEHGGNPAPQRKKASQRSSGTSCPHCSRHESAYDVLAEALSEAREELRQYRELGECQVLTQSVLESAQDRVEMDTLREALRELQGDYAEVARLHDDHRREVDGAVRLAEHYQSEAEQLRRELEAEQLRRELEAEQLRRELESEGRGVEAVVEANAALAERESSQEDVIARLRGRVQLLESRLNRIGIASPSPTQRGRAPLPHKRWATTEGASLVARQWHAQLDSFQLVVEDILEEASSPSYGNPSQLTASQRKARISGGGPASPGWVLDHGFDVV